VNYNDPSTGATASLLSSVDPNQLANVAVWYDQSGGGNNAVQAITSKQPTVNTSSQVPIPGGPPPLGLDFSGNNYLVITSTAFNGDLSGTFVYDGGQNNAATGTAANWHNMNGIFSSGQTGGVNDFGYGIYNNALTAGNGPVENSVSTTAYIDEVEMINRYINSWTRSNSTGAVSL